RETRSVTWPVLAVEDRGSRIEDRGSRIEDREEAALGLRASIFYPRSSILDPLFPLSGQGRARLELLDDELVEPGPGVVGGDAEGVLDGPVAGAAVADDADAVNAQQRRPAVRAVVVATDQRLQGLLGPAAPL